MFIRPGTMLQVLAALLFGGIFTTMHIKSQPFLDDQDDALQLCSLLSATLTFWAAALILAADPANCSPETAGASPAMVGIFMVLINVSVLGLALYVAITDTLPAVIA